MKLVNQLKELQKEGVISPQIATDIYSFYEEKGESAEKRQTVIFSVIGSLLVGLGLILVFAHNWDELSKLTKTVVAIAPLCISQLIAIYILAKQKDSLAGREGVGSLIFLCIGLAISLVGQIYNLHGDFGKFLKVWMLLALPMIYLLRSSMVAFLVLGGSTWYALESHYFGSYESTITYWLIVAAILLFFIHLYKKNPASNYINIATWLIPAAFCFGLYSFESNQEEVLLLVYLGMFSAFQWFGNGKSLEGRPVQRNGLKFFGTTGILFLLFLLSFDDIGEELMRNRHAKFSLEWIGFIAVLLANLFLMVRERQLFKNQKLNPVLFVFIPISVLAFVTTASFVIVFFVNAIILLIGIFKVISGLKEGLIGRLNFGLLVIGILVTCRFFDRDMSFIFRGIVFLALGASFLLSNLWVLKKRKNETK